MNKRKTTQGQGPGHAQLVPWKSSNDEITIKVPVSATIASSIMLLSAMIVLYGVISFMQEDDKTAWKTLMLTGCMVTSTQVPVLIGKFIFRHL